jgi:DNA-binding PadR family transcriptional regulator
MFGPFGHGRFKERLFERGELKYVILDLLEQKPKHGYEIIRDLEERFGGLYSPSPGAVYPTLQMLEDLGHVTSSQQDGKRVYRITEEGRAFAAERRATMDDIEGRTRKRLYWFDDEGARKFGEEMRAFAHDMKGFGKVLIRTEGKAWRDPAKRERIREVLKRTRQEIEEIMKEEGETRSS